MAYASLTFNTDICMWAFLLSNGVQPAFELIEACRDGVSTNNMEMDLDRMVCL